MHRKDNETTNLLGEETALQNRVEWGELYPYNAGQGGKHGVIVRPGRGLRRLGTQKGA